MNRGYRFRETVAIMARIINFPKIDILYSRNSPGLNFYSIVKRFELVCSGDQICSSDDHSSYLGGGKSWIKKVEIQD